MKETGKLRIAEKDAAFVLKENWDIELAVPKGPDEGVVSRNFQFIAYLFFLTRKDPEFIGFVWERGERLVEEAENGAEHPLDSAISKATRSPTSAHEETGTADEIEIEGTDAGFVLKENWDIDVCIPMLHEGSDDVSLPDHTTFIVLVAALIKTDPEFVRSVWERGRKYVTDTEPDNAEPGTM